MKLNVIFGQNFWFNLRQPLSPYLISNNIYRKIYNLSQKIGNVEKYLSSLSGQEYFNYPATLDILNLPDQKPDLLHCHNLHGDYFDLRILPFLSQKVPTILTLHDAWLLSGHCAHSFECDRWKYGCGNCPDLTIPPAIKKDATAYNWQRKKEIYQQSKLYVATPSQWLMNKVNESILTEGIIKSRVIPNGIDLSIFCPQNKQQVRNNLQLPQDSKIILFTANGIRKNPWKDYETMSKAVGLVAQKLEGENILFLALGEASKTEKNWSSHN
jgi:glycosyltransferase involved in cell wall biosynthesis